jgi:lysophospholipase L1-like esterase
VGGGADGSALATELVSRFDRERRVRVVDLGRDARLHDPALRLDGFHFSAAGHSRAAELVSPCIIDLIRAEGPR